MHPNLRNGDIVHVSPADSLSLRPGDIALAQTSDGLKVHRVAAIHPSSGKIITRGDAGQDSDREVLNVLAKVTAFSRNNSQHPVSSFETRLLHPLASLLRRVHLAARRRLSRLFAIVPILISFFTLSCFFAPAVSAQTDLALTQNASPAVVAPGANITYTEVVTNTGATANSVVLYQRLLRIPPLSPSRLRAPPPGSATIPALAAPARSPAR
jgi:hypothetical protein